MTNETTTPFLGKQLLKYCSNIIFFIVKGTNCSKSLVIESIIIQKCTLYRSSNTIHMHVLPNAVYNTYIIIINLS